LSIIAVLNDAPLKRMAYAPKNSPVLSSATARAAIRRAHPEWRCGAESVLIALRNRAA
jgi:hypothetical protein